MASIKPTTVPSKRLAASITAASSSLQLNNILGWDGNALTASDFGTKLYAVLRNDANTLMEIIELDPATIASASITVLRRGLKFDGDLTTEVTANKLSWVKNETIVELGTDVPQLLKHYVDTLEAQSIDGVKTFSSFPQKSGSTTPTQAKELASKEYVDSVAGGSANYDQNIIPGTAGETIAVGNLVYLKTDDGKWWKTDANTGGTVYEVKFGFAQGAADADGAVNILIGGVDKNQSGLTPGAIYYASDTAGAISSSAGTINRPIGQALTATTIILDPNIQTLIRSSEKSAMVGTAGTPSGTNKFVTNDDTATSGADKVLRLDGSGKLPALDGSQLTNVFKFGGTGADGALSITTGTTTLDLAGAQVFVKNYTTISITGDGKLAFSNPHNNGTLIILKATGNVTLTSSTVPCINTSGMGAAVGYNPTGILDTDNHYGANGAGSEANGAAGAIFNAATQQLYTFSSTDIYRKSLFLVCGASGGNGFTGTDAGCGGGAGSRYGAGGTGDAKNAGGPMAGGSGRKRYSSTATTGGAGGRGGGALLIECGGDLNFTGTIYARGVAGGNSPNNGAGGGGGAGATIVILYNGDLTAGSGTMDNAGGAGGGNTGGGAGGNGGASKGGVLAKNTEF